MGGDNKGGRFPFSLPTGWFQVGYSHELGVEDVVPLHVFDQQLVMFRDGEGDAVVLDAFCPHLGAHLGHGGKVCEGKLVCPFHGWAFDGQGQCVDVPYAEKLPKKASLAAWKVIEKNGLILVWHDLAGREPFMEVPDFPEISSEEWTDFKTREWTVGTCNQEMAENAVDTQLIMRTDTVMKTAAGKIDGKIEVDLYGFGVTTTRFKGLVETFLIGATTPIDGNSCILRFTFMLRKMGDVELDKGIGGAFIREIERQLEQDIPVWENKIYLDRPLIVKEDGPIGLFRTWARQFYPESGGAK
jgi:3-ketosteroid 9alpha-monooxygenase subunit A